MTNQFARFNHTSPLSSISHDPTITLASNAIRDSFGPTVQLVADGLQARAGYSTLTQILQNNNNQAHKKSMAEKATALSQTAERKRIVKASGLQSAPSNGCPSISAVRAALLVLINHSMVTVKKSTTTVGIKTRVTVSYKFNPDEARLLPRYPRFVEYTKKALDETAAALVEMLLVQGRMRTVDAIVATVEQLHQIQENSDSAPKPDGRYTYRQAVLESFRRLVAGGFIQPAPMIVDEADALNEENQYMEEADGGPPSKKQRTSPPVEHDTEDPAVVSLLQSGQYKILPRDAIWRVNLRLFHDSLRAVSLGWLVAERYGHKVQSAGSMVTAALKLAAFKKHASSQQNEQDYESQNTFGPDQITRYLPKTVLQSLEKKPGGVLPNLHRALQELCSFTNPAVIEEVEVADGHPEQSKFQVATRKLVAYLQDRIMHQVLVDSHGEVAARICSILKVNGHMESDAVAEAAMVPAKDTREVLHRLYRENYIQLFNVNQGKQHNPSSMFYLWSVSRARLLPNVTDNVCLALLNMRLRRQHEVEVGKDWIERAKEAGATDENENETDKVNYTRFCQGLERLDNATLQLDETLMVLKDYWPS